MALDAEILGKVVAWLHNKGRLQGASLAGVSFDLVTFSIIEGKVREGEKTVQTIDDWDLLIAYTKSLFQSESRKGEALALLKKAFDENILEEANISAYLSGKLGLRFTRKIRKPGIPAPCRNALPRIFRALEHEKSVNREAFAEFKATRLKPIIEEVPPEPHRFVGRKSELEVLHAKLQKDSRLVSILGKVATLKGAGGQGKTALARRYCFDYRAEYNAIFWINARGLPLLEQIDELASRHNVTAATEDGEEGLKQRIENLADRFRGTLLIVVDDVPAPESGDGDVQADLKAFVSAIPDRTARYFRFLVTSRHSLVEEGDVVGIEEMDVKPLEYNDAVELLGSITQMVVDSKNSLIHRLLAKTLGCHALSVVLVASYIREQRITDFESVIARLNTQIATSDVIQERTVEDYPKTMMAAFQLSFEVLSDETQAVLMLFGLFRRGPLSRSTLTQIARQLSSSNSSILGVKTDLLGRASPNRALAVLKRHALLTDLSQRATKNIPERMEVHEVIYDFVHAKWSEAKSIGLFDWLDDLENAFTRAAVDYASHEINKDTISFSDVDALSGMLIPIVRSGRGFYPSLERVKIALQFWFDHYKFQNFIYDIGLQELFLGQMIDLLSFVREHDDLPIEHKIILNKLIGHAFYADPAAKKDEASAYFNRALELLVDADTQKENSLPDNRSAFIWYSVFLRDHRTNFQSKGTRIRNKGEAARSHPMLKQDFDLIEKALPETLKSLERPVTAEVEALLLRSAHYWGHRGNQDADVARELMELERLGSEFLDLTESASEHYAKAATFRIAVIAMLRPRGFNRYLKTRIENETLPGIPQWLLCVQSRDSRVGMEGFTSLAQGLGDVAHQYRGLHFTEVLRFVAAKDEKARVEISNRANRAFKAAKNLWASAEKALGAEETPIKYRLWMASSYQMEVILDAVTSKQILPSEDQIISKFRIEYERIQESLRGEYQFSYQPQKNILQLILKQFVD